MHKAFWISPRGEKLDVPLSHIQLVLSDPETFDLNKEELIAIYRKYNEKIGVEGKARGEIMTVLLKKGWVRVRYNPRYDQWTIQTFASSEEIDENIRNWIRLGLSEGFINKLSDYKLLLIKDNHISEGKITDLYSETIDK